MRKALIGILMAATVATPLAAQNNDGRRDRDNAGQQRQQARPQRQAPQARQQAPQGQRPQGGSWAGQRNVQQQAQPQGQGRGAWQGRGGAGWNGQNRFQQQAPAQGQPQAQGRSAWQGRGGAGSNGQNRFQQGNASERGYGQPRGYAPQQGNRYGGNRQAWNGNRGGGGGRWDRGWRNEGRYDWQRYRYANRGIFHLGPYYAPYRGYGYNPLEIGIVLDSLFYDRNYWIDPSYYDLPEAPPGAEWVRYYNDVVLVDMDSGEVLDVIHDFFW